PGGADQEDELALPDLEGQILHGGDPALVALRDLLEADHDSGEGTNRRGLNRGIYGPTRSISRAAGISCPTSHSMWQDRGPDSSNELDHTGPWELACSDESPCSLPPCSRSLAGPSGSGAPWRATTSRR